MIIPVFLFQFANITGVSMIVGMSTAADTLCPQVLCSSHLSMPCHMIYHMCMYQSYGYKNYKQVGVILQRGKVWHPEKPFKNFIIVFLRFADHCRDMRSYCGGVAQL